MRRIGIRELRQRASHYLREVQAGESIEVTDRGRPVARLVPHPRTTGMDDLAAEGRLDQASGDALEIGGPLAPADGKPLPSVALADIRADER
jgi:prevent-host-death family protein